MMTQTNPTRAEIRKLFRANPGSVVAVARSLGITHVTVSLWLKGKTTSARVEEAARKKALELMDGRSAGV